MWVSLCCVQYACVCMCVCMRACVRACACACVWICVMYVCVYVYARSPLLSSSYFFPLILVGPHCQHAQARNLDDM